jgi:predicted dehydrogenase
LVGVVVEHCRPATQGNRDMTEPVRIGLIGAGPWAAMVHAPLFAAGPGTVLNAVWARRYDAAELLAQQHGARAVATPGALFDCCDAVVFSVPPAVQAELGVEAARAGKALVLEKPIAADLAGAERLAAAVVEAGVPSALVLTWRYTEVVRQFLAAAPAIGAFGGRGAFIGGGLIRGPFRTPWRVEAGPLLDLGPHVIDLLDAALGPVAAVQATGRLSTWVSLLLEHEGGAVSDVALCAHAPIHPHRAGAELYGERGQLSVDCAAAVGPAAFATLREEIVAMVRAQRSHPIDVHRGLHLQRIIGEATRQLTR